MKLLLLQLSFAALALSFSASALDWKAKGSGALVELYTSEGCSSCPPADAWVSELKNKAGLWSEFVPIVFHVDYWDNLGWPDRFAKSEFTQRQRRYATLWKSSTVFTPAIIIQGDNSSRAKTFPPLSHSIEATWDTKNLIVKASGLKGASLHIAWLAMDVATDVKRGENAGRKLTHNFIVLDHQHLGAHEDAKSWPLSLPVNPVANLGALAVWLEQNQRPVVATGNFLH